VGTGGIVPAASSVRLVGYLSLTGDAARDVDAVEGWLSAAHPDPVVIATSGSSGAPKQVVLTRDAVLASAAASAARVGGTGPWVLALPSSYVAGFNVVLRSLVAGHRPLVLGGDSLAQVALPGGFLSVVPTQLHRWLDTPAERAALADLHTVLVGGGPVDPALRSRATEVGVHLIATYGSAETCGGCVYDGLPLDGVGLALTADGRIRITGPTLFSGYLDDDAATREALVDGWFLTSDAGRLDEDGRLRVLGRVDDMVVSGGVNVPAAAVARRLREHPAVVAAEVVGVPDPEWGNRVVAVLSLVEAVEALTLDEARTWVADRHPRAWAPRELVVVPTLPMLTNGKVDRLAVRELAGGAAR
jgi:O-succinylbenzoic acid--CoA ligase